MIKPRFGESRPYWDITGNKQAEDYTRLMRARAVYAKNLTDGRQIRIDAEHGIQALDSEDTVIHDTPNCVIASDMTYGGHIIWQDAPNYIDIQQTQWEDTETSRSGYTTLKNTALSSYLPTGLTNAKGAKVHIDVSVNVYGSKTQNDTQITTLFLWSNTYNQNPGSYNISLRSVYTHPASDADNQTINYTSPVNDILPITWNGSDPYLTWYLNYSFTWMTSQNDTYQVIATIYLTGFTV